MPVTDPYFDASKIAAAQKAQGAGADGRTVLTGANLLSILNQVNAPTYHEASTRLETHGQDDPTMENDPAYYQDSYGNILNPADGAQFGDPTGKYFTNSLENPSSTGGKDQAMVTYKINPDGTATPVAANNQYAPSAWSDWGRLATELGAVVGTAGIGGAALAGGGAGSTLGGGATVAAGTGGETLSGMDLAADAAAGSGNYAGGLGAAEAGGGGLATSAPAYMGPGTAGAGATGEGAAPWYQGILDSLGTPSASSAGDLLKGIGQMAGAKPAGGTGVAGGGVGGGGLSAGDKYRQQLMQQALSNPAQTQQAMPGWIPGG